MKTADALAEIGCTYRQLDSWVRSGLLSSLPAHQRSDPLPGSGSPRKLTRAEVDLLRQVESLRRAGVSLQAIRQSLKRYGSLRPLLEDLTDTIAMEEFAGELVEVAS